MCRKGGNFVIMNFLRYNFKLIFKFIKSTNFLTIKILKILYIISFLREKFCNFFAINSSKSRMGWEKVNKESCLITILKSFLSFLSCSNRSFNLQIPRASKSKVLEVYNVFFPLCGLKNSHDEFTTRLTTVIVPIDKALCSI